MSVVNIIIFVSKYTQKQFMSALIQTLNNKQILDKICQIGVVLLMVFYSLVRIMYVYPSIKIKKNLKETLFI